VWESKLAVERSFAMYWVLPGDAMTSALEMVFYSFTVIAAVVSCLMNLRG